MPLQSASELIARADELKAKKSNAENYAQIAAKYCLPHKANITEKKEEGSRVATDVYDSTPIEAAQVAAAGLQAFLTSPAARWFALRFKDKELNEDDGAREWLQDVEEKTYDILNGSNFNRSIGEFFHDFVVLPGSIIYEEEDVQDVVRFTNIPFDEILIATNARGEVDEIHRRFQLTVKQAYGRWGEKCGKVISDAFRAGKLSEKYEFQHSIAPRHERRVGKKSAVDMPFYSCYIMVKSKVRVEEKGYQEFPFFVGRWRVNTGEDWGYSPAMVAISDILMLNEMAKTLIQAGQQAVSPAWLFPDENFILPLSLNPNTINYRTANAGATSASEKDPMPLVSKSNMPIGLEMQAALREAIKRYFFNDLFLPLLEKQATAFEVAKVIEKRMTILGAVVGGLTKHVLEPIITRTYKIASRLPEGKTIYEPIPGSVKDKAAIEIEYVSPLASAQKAVTLQNLESFLFSIAQMAGIDPEVLDLVDWDEAGKEIANIQSITPKILRKKTDIDERRQVRREAQAQANALQMAAMGGEALERTGKGIQAVNGKERKAA